MTDLENPILKNIESGQIIEVIKSPFSIGRALTSDYVIGSKVVSREHCSLEKTDKGWILVDSSTNGTMVNDNVFKDGPSTILNNNDEICLGYTTYTYKFILKTDIPQNLQVERLRNGEAEAISRNEPGSTPSSPSSFDENGISDEVLNDLADVMLCDVNERNKDPDERPSIIPEDQDTNANAILENKVPESHQSAIEQPASNYNDQNAIDIPQEQQTSENIDVNASLENYVHESHQTALEQPASCFNDQDANDIPQEQPTPEIIGVNVILDNNMPELHQTAVEQPAIDIAQEQGSSENTNNYVSESNIPESHLATSDNQVMTSENSNSVPEQNNEQVYQYSRILDPVALMLQSQLSDQIGSNVTIPDQHQDITNDVSSAILKSLQEVSENNILAEGSTSQSNNLPSIPQGTADMEECTSSAGTITYSLPDELPLGPPITENNILSSNLEGNNIPTPSAIQVNSISTELHTNNNSTNAIDTFNIDDLIKKYSIVESNPFVCGNPSTSTNSITAPLIDNTVAGADANPYFSSVSYRMGTSAASSSSVLASTNTNATNAIDTSKITDKVERFKIHFDRVLDDVIKKYSVDSNPVVSENPSTSTNSISAPLTKNTLASVPNRMDTSTASSSSVGIPSPTNAHKKIKVMAPTSTVSAPTNQNILVAPFTTAFAPAPIRVLSSDELNNFVASGRSTTFNKAQRSPVGIKAIGSGPYMINLIRPVHISGANSFNPIQQNVVPNNVSTFKSAHTITTQGNNVGVKIVTSVQCSTAPTSAAGKSTPVLLSVKPSITISDAAKSSNTLPAKSIDDQKPTTSKEPDKPHNQGLDKNQYEEMENEMMCTICANLFIKAVTLGCSHSFCQYCIEMWKKKKSDCPICRKKITSSTRTLVLDNIIEKMMESASEEDKTQRNEAVEERKKIDEAAIAAKNAQNAANNRRNMARRGRRNGAGNNNRRGNNNAAAPPPQPPPQAPPRPPPVAVQAVINLIDSPSTTDSENSDQSLDSDDSDYNYDDYYADEWYNGRPGAYFGGYGRCYNCGDRGHWANGCPNR